MSANSFVVIGERRDNEHRNMVFVCCDSAAGVNNPEYFNILGTCNTFEESEKLTASIAMEDGKDYTRKLINEGFPNYDPSKSQQYRWMFAYLGEDFTIEPAIYYIPMSYYKSLEPHVKSLRLPTLEELENVKTLKETIIVHDNINENLVDVIEQLNMRDHHIFFKSEESYDVESKDVATQSMIIMFKHLRNGNTSTLKYYEKQFQQMGLTVDQYINELTRLELVMSDLNIIKIMLQIMSQTHEQADSQQEKVDE